MEDRDLSIVVAMAVALLLVERLLETEGSEESDDD